MRATIEGTVIAEAPEGDLVRIEGNWYFPRSAVAEGALAESPTAYTCPWKGKAAYFNLSADGTELKDAAWSYPEPKEAAKEIKGHLAFDRSKGISVA